ncbi:MAG TPA: MarR family winged helix-turn-helix transcriptional regulator [Microbacteriaceae bacterium]|nr:MarR family winged helix-turn-helix transcriptional regulator [Microbacteriaceae bacterium]
MSVTGRTDVSDRDYAKLLRLRTRLREFEYWSAQQAAARGLTSAQHQLMLAVRGHKGDKPPTIGQIAGYLMIGHAAAVGLADRTEALGLVCRHRDRDDHRIVRLTLTAVGAEKLAELTGAHLAELDHIEPLLAELYGDLNS